MRYLLAIDLGIRTGLALYGDNGKLSWYRSHNLGTTERLKRAAHGILDEWPDLAAIVIEGGGNLAGVWEREAQRRGIPLFRIDAPAWRKLFLYSREQRTGADAKHHADEFARMVITWSEASQPTSLRHDAAEAILIGLWGVMHLGWLRTRPEELRR